MRVAKNRIDLTGKVFSRLTVISVGGRKGSKLLWRCSCVCGSTTEVEGRHLRSGAQVSCGCYRSENSRIRSTRHGLGARASQVWRDMLARCYNENCAAYPNYGGRGVTVCDRWRESLLSFVKDMGQPPVGMELDRRDNNGNYEPDNCRWVTHTVNCSNTRRSVLFEVDGQQVNIPELARRAGINKSTLYDRVRRLGWPLDRALSC
jgi:hypothetical protein